MVSTIARRLTRTINKHARNATSVTRTGNLYITADGADSEWQPRETLWFDGIERYEYFWRLDGEPVTERAVQEWLDR